MKTFLGHRWARRKEKFQQSWDKFVFNLSLRQKTVAMHDEVLTAAEDALAHQSEHESDEACLASSDPLVRQGWTLKRQVERKFRNLYSGKPVERILIQVPASAFSPAGYSLFTNMAESLEFIGIPTAILRWDDNTDQVLQDFRPTVLMSSDHASYLERIDWSAVDRYKRSRRLRVGLTASLAEYDNTPLRGRLDWAARNGVDFYYTFRDEDYVETRAAYRPFFDAGYSMLYLPFGANILHYYPVSGFERDLDFAIMATRKSEHMTYMRDIVRRYAGFIDGPGWRHVRSFSFNRDRDRYVYARTRVGLNVHLPEQLEWACEVNERTYQLAACGVPQLVDHPRLIDKLFSRDAVYVADSPAEYTRLFTEIMRQPRQAMERALIAQREVFGRHTTFHRADALVRQLM